MKELEKMLKGELYNANYDKEILKIRQQSQDLCYEFNQTRSSNKKNEKK
ncbi:MAG: maltose acetyltransferase domain-containing protein [Anaerococcus hydrogenalis]|nr:maltose acetyltransferase domain-containing protein [Anaerococcus hydrogenalis]MDU2582835.1 maltose acetyltransferase domain-containing protein [Anaerococcus hydrogenalis]